MGNITTFKTKILTTKGMRNIIFFMCLIIIWGCNREQLPPNNGTPNAKRQIGVCDIGIDSKWYYNSTYTNGNFTNKTDYVYAVIDTITAQGRESFLVQVTNSLTSDTSYFAQRTDSLGTYRYFSNGSDFVKYPAAVNDSFMSNGSLIMVKSTDTTINGYNNCTFYQCITDSTTHNYFYQYNTGLVYESYLFGQSDTIIFSLTQRQ